MDVKLKNNIIKSNLNYSNVNKIICLTKIQMAQIGPLK